MGYRINIYEDEGLQVKGLEYGSSVMSTVNWRITKSCCHSRGNGNPGLGQDDIIKNSWIPA